VMKRSVKILKQMNNLDGDEDVMRVIGEK